MMGSAGKVGLGKDARLKRCVSECLTSLFSAHLSLDGAPQRADRHLPHRASAVRPFVIRKAFRRFPNGMNQACFACLAEANANRPVEADLFHFSVETWAVR